MSNPNPNTSGLIPAKPGNQRAKKDVTAKQRQIRATDRDWNAIKEAAGRRNTSEFIRDAAMTKIEGGMFDPSQKMYTWLLQEYIKSNNIESLDELFESEYEAQIDQIFSHDVPNDIRDAGLLAFQ